MVSYAALSIINPFDMFPEVVYEVSLQFIKAVSIAWMPKERYFFFYIFYYLCTFFIVFCVEAQY